MIKNISTALLACVCSLALPLSAMANEIAATPEATGVVTTAAATQSATTTATTLADDNTSQTTAPIEKSAQPRVHKGKPHHGKLHHSMKKHAARSQHPGAHDKKPAHLND